MTSVIAAGTSEHETFGMDIFEGFRNRIGQEFRFESRGKDIAIVIRDGDKELSFIIEYKDRLCLEKIKGMSAKVKDIVDKNSGNVARIEDAKKVGE